MDSLIVNFDLFQNKPFGKHLECHQFTLPAESQSLKQVMGRAEQWVTECTDANVDTWRKVRYRFEFKARVGDKVLTIGFNDEAMAEACLCH